jgi:hypothetical protein
MSRLHLIAALFVCLILPGGSWLQGSGWLAWVMFSKSATYRLTIVATERNGNKRRVAPMELGAHAGHYAARFLSGAERFRHAPVGATFRSHLPELASLGCKITHARRVELTLVERATLDSPVLMTTARTDCSSSGTP